MSNAIALRQTQDLIVFSEEKRALIRNTIANGLTDQEFNLFMSIASARGLDPVLRQIHAVKRKDGDGKFNMVIQVGIDGFRLIASRTREYAGCDEPEFEYDGDGELKKAKVTTYRMINGQKCAFTGVAVWDEFYPGDKQGFMWRKMPHNQLAKCAEAQALRKGFPGDLSGMYVPEELEREAYDVTPKETDKSSFDDDPRIKEIRVLLGKFEKLGVSELDIVNKYKLENSYALSDEQIRELKVIGSDLINNRKTKAEVFSNEQEF